VLDGLEEGFLFGEIEGTSALFDFSLKKHFFILKFLLTFRSINHQYRCWELSINQVEQLLAVNC